MLGYHDLKWDGNKVTIYKYFEREFSDNELEEIDAKIINGKLKIKNFDEERNERKVERWFGKYKKNLKFKLNNNKAIFVDEDLGIPLIGMNFLGILDKGSEILEIKPITNCNASCSFCSVNEGIDSDKEVDFVVDTDFLISETKRLLSYKNSKNMSLWINPHGEPTLWAGLTDYCKEMLKNEYVSKIHIITNGILLTNKLVDELEKIKNETGKEIGLSTSLSGLSKNSEEKSKVNKKGLSLSELTMGEGYKIDKVLKNLKYAVKKLPVMITPVLIPGMNEKEMSKLIDLMKDLKKEGNVEIMIQKFCKNKNGRNPVKEKSWNEFFDFLKNLEKEKNVDLTKPLGKVQETKELPELFFKKEKTKAKIVCSGRYYKDRIGVVEKNGEKRAITILNSRVEKGNVNVTILQSKHNVVVGN